MQTFFGFDRTEIGLEHHVELAGLSPLTRLPRFRIPDIGKPVGWRMPVLLLIRLNEMVGTITLVRDQRLDQRVVEHLDMPGANPHVARQDDRGVQAYNIISGRHDRLPPLPFDVLFEFDT